MEISHVIVLALVQGISEFLPISSSAHLILVPKLLGWPDQGLAFDVAVHVGTLSAILFYFKDTIFKLLRDFFASIVQRKMVGDSLLVWCVGFATIPVGIFGLLFNNIFKLTGTDIIDLYIFKYNYVYGHGYTTICNISRIFPLFSSTIFYNGRFCNELFRNK